MAMRLPLPAAALAALLAPQGAAAQACGGGVAGPFLLSDLEGRCTYDKLLAAYVDQVYSASGALPGECALDSFLSDKLPLSCSPLYVEFDNSGSNTKTVAAPGLTAHHTCPTTVDKSNWDREACDDRGNHCSVPDTFAITTSIGLDGNTVTARRTDSSDGWGLNMAFTCECPGSPAQLDFDAKVMNATGAATGAEGAAALCRQLYDGQDIVPFTRAAAVGDDLHFERMFYNGLSDWQEEVETHYESADGSHTSRLREDAAKVKEFYHGEGSYARVKWPGALSNFNSGGGDCPSRAAMCCWPKDRQANDNNGNCATPYDKNCVDKDVADNTNLCFADYRKGDQSSGYGADRGFAVFPGDNNDGEGAIHCHGFAWADDEYDHTARYRANNLFFVSMYDHMHQRGYVKEIPGMPMCGCMEQMPVATRSDCTQVDLTEDWEVAYDGSSFEMRMTKIEIDFNACRGRNNRNNDLWAYAARLYDEGRMTNKQFGIVGRVLTNDNDCHHGVVKAKHDKGFVTGYVHDPATWTQVAGRDAMYRGTPMGGEAFARALGDSVTPDFPIVHRICPHCVPTHQDIYYRRLTPPPDGFDLLNDLLRHDNNSPATGNKWNEDFTLHSTYADAVTGANPWGCNNNSFRYNHAFYGRCSPDGSQVNNQHSNWRSHPGPQPDVAFFVNKPESTGLQDYAPGSTGADGETDEDIGIFGLEGNTLEEDGVYHISGAGSDIWGWADSFHYLSQPWDGDIDVRVRVSDFHAPNEWAKAGIMLRADNSPDATHVMISLTRDHGVLNSYRWSKGNHVSHTERWNSAPDTVWLRLRKKMESVEFFTATDEAGEDWTLRATTLMFFPEDHYRVGLAVTSQNRDYLADATFDGYEIQAYEFPTSAPSGSPAPTVYDPIDEIDTQREGSYARAGDGTETFKGSGTGLAGKRDSFFFHSRQRPVDDAEFWAEMRISKFDGGSVNGRGGIMIRDSLEPDAANAFVGAASHRQGVVFQSRAAAGQKTAHHAMNYVNAANTFWVKLVKAGNVLTASYREMEWDAWTVVGSVELTFTSDVLYVGRALTGGSENHLETMETEHYAVYPDEDAPSAAPTLSTAPTFDGINVIPDNAVASQVCTQHGGSASRAIDGNTDGEWGHGSVTHTCYRSGPWWKVDLKRDDVIITNVSVFNRSDCCQSRLANDVNLEILDASGTVVASKPFKGTQDRYDFTFNQVVGRAVRIKKNSHDALNVAEVQVYGK